MGSSSPMKGENKTYLSCHRPAKIGTALHLEPFEGIKLTSYLVSQDFKNTYLQGGPPTSYNLGYNSYN